MTRRRDRRWLSWTPSSGGEDFYGYSAAGFTASSLTFGTKTWTLSNLSSQTIKGQDADFWTNTDLTLGAPTSIAALFGHGDGVLKLGGIYLKGGQFLFKNVDISQFLPDAYGAMGGGYALSTSVTPAAVPEPASLLFVGTGLVGLVMRRRSSKGH